MKKYCVDLNFKYSLSYENYISSHFLNIFIIRCQLKRHFKFEWKWHDNLIWIFYHNFDLIEQNLTIHVLHMSTYLTIEASSWIVTEFYDTIELVVMNTRVWRQVKTLELFNYERKFISKIFFKHYNHILKINFHE